MAAENMSLLGKETALKKDLHERKKQGFTSFLQIEKQAK